MLLPVKYAYMGQFGNAALSGHGELSKSQEAEADGPPGPHRKVATLGSRERERFGARRSRAARGSFWR